MDGYDIELALSVREMTKEFIFTDTKCQFSQSENSFCYETSNHVSSNWEDPGELGLINSNRLMVIKRPGHPT